MQNQAKAVAIPLPGMFEDVSLLIRDLGDMLYGTDRRARITLGITALTMGFFGLLSALEPMRACAL